MLSNRSCPPSQTLHFQLLFMMPRHQLSIGNLRLLTTAWKTASINFILGYALRVGSWLLRPFFFGGGGRAGVHVCMCLAWIYKHVLSHIEGEVIPLFFSFVIETHLHGLIVWIKKKIILLVHMKLLMFSRWSKQWWITSSAGSQLILGDNCCQK